MQETQKMRARSLGQEDRREKGMATLRGILVWRILWTEESGRLQPTGSQRVGHNRSDGVPWKGGRLKLPTPSPAIQAAVTQNTALLTAAERCAGSAGSPRLQTREGGAPLSRVPSRELLPLKEIGEHSLMFVPHGLSAGSPALVGLPQSSQIQSFP